MTKDSVEKRGILNLATCKCPRCREGNMFSYSNPYNLQNFMNMNDKCPVCKQPFDLEPGFYYGTSYVSYAFTIAITIASFTAWWVIIGVSVNNNRVFYWLVVNAVLLLLLQPVVMRVARTVWLAFLLLMTLTGKFTNLKNLTVKIRISKMSGKSFR